MKYDFYTYRYLSKIFPPHLACVVTLPEKIIIMQELETVSIADPLQIQQHVQAPYLGQIWNATVGQWSMLTGHRLNFVWITVLCQVAWWRNGRASDFRP